MMLPKRFAYAAVVAQVCAAASVFASVTVNVDAGRLRENAASPMQTGALLLLIASGPDSAFANTSVEAGQFVAGDDVVLAAAEFNNFNGPDFTSNAFTFAIPATAQSGQLLALRWFPATTFAAYNGGSKPAAGQPFGTYNPRMYGDNFSDNPDGGNAWVLPGDGATIELRFFTTDSAAAGTQTPSRGYANFTVQQSTTGTPTPTPIPTATPSPSPTVTPEPSASPSPTVSPSPSPSATPSPSPSPSPTPASHLANIATRLRVGTGDNVLIAGFILRGIGEKPVVLRGIGPSLSLPGRLIDPVLELYDSDGEQIAINDDWQNDPNAAEVQASTLAPSDPKEAALFRRLVTTPAADTTLYTAVVSGKSGTTGIGVVEVYDLEQAGAVQVVNIATRGFVQRDDDVMIGGVIVTGNGQAELVVRAIGPSLELDNKLADPVLELFNNDGDRIAINDDWKDDQQTAIEASGLAPRDDRESALRISLSAGNYTAIVSGGDGGIGVGVVEVYKLSP